MFDHLSPLKRLLVIKYNPSLLLHYITIEFKLKVSLVTFTVHAENNNDWIGFLEQHVSSCWDNERSVTASYGSNVIVVFDGLFLLMFLTVQGSKDFKLNRERDIHTDNHIPDLAWLQQLFESTNHLLTHFYL